MSKQSNIIVNSKSIITTLNLYDKKNNLNFKLLDTDIFLKLPSNVVFEINDKLAIIIEDDVMNDEIHEYNGELEIEFTDKKSVVSDNGMICEIPSHPLHRYFLSKMSTFVIMKMTRVLLFETFDDFVSNNYIDCYLSNNYNCNFYVENRTVISNKITNECDFYNETSSEDSVDEGDYDVCESSSQNDSDYYQTSENESSDSYVDEVESINDSASDYDSTGENSSVDKYRDDTSSTEDEDNDDNYNKEHNNNSDNDDDYDIHKSDTDCENIYNTLVKEITSI